jgi:hypothetical protein
MFRRVKEKAKELAEDYHLEIAPAMTNKSQSALLSNTQNPANKKSNSSSSRLFILPKQTNALNFIYIHNENDDKYDNNDNLYLFLLYLLELSTITSNVIARILLHMRWLSLERRKTFLSKVKILIRCKCLKILYPFLSSLRFSFHFLLLCVFKS